MRGVRIGDTVASRRQVTDVPGRRTQTTHRLQIVTDRREEDQPAAPQGASSRASDVEPSPKGNLPLQLSSFVGRKREMAEVEGLLVDHRLLTLTGPGGCGKTRLALAVASNLADGFEVGAWWVGLASLSDPDLVARAVAQALDVREAPGRSFVEALAEHLRSKEALLVLDNCEHLVAACAALADALLRVCPDLRVLATSREALGVAGERAWLVPPLSLPDLLHPYSIQELTRYEAVRLFVERAEAAASDFALTEQDAPVLAQLCRRLDGIPLAIELAAAKTRVLSVDQISARLDNTFRLLAGGSRTALPRQQALRAAMDWSHDLLSEDERTLFRRVSVFAGGFTLEAAEEICSGEGIEKDDVLDLLTHLVDKSLVLVIKRGGGSRSEEARYRLLETIRQYASEKLDESGEKAALRSRYAGFFLALAEEAEPNLLGPEQAAWVERLEREYDNLRAALGWLREEGEAERSLRLGGALWRFWWLKGHFTEGKDQLEAILNLRGAETRTAERAKALFVLGELSRRRGDYAGGDHAEARRCQEESLGIYRELGDRERTAAALSELGRISLELEDWDTARSFLEESLRIYRELDDDHGLAVALESLGWLAHFEGSNAAARPFLEEALAIFGGLGDSLYVGICLYLLGSIATDQGDYATAHARLVEIAEKAPLMQYHWAIPRYLEGWSVLAAAQGQAAQALRLAGAAAALRESIGASQMPAWHSHLERWLEPARCALGQQAAEEAFEDGRALSLEGAIGEAIEPEPEGSTKERPDRPAGLTDREVEVLGLVAEGLTDVQIAERLYVSPRTVGWHLRSVYRKLGVGSRTAALRRATELGLL
jgi:predicted ATPase/DNA-binding CsgD family transcriptional regulator